MVSLGCPKNLVDSEAMLGLLKAHGFRICDSVEDADIAIVNTCSFIEDAKIQSVDIILRVAKLKKERSLKHLIVTGCLVQRYPEIVKELPEVDAFLGTGDFPKIPLVVNEVISGKKAVKIAPRPVYLYDHRTPRFLITPGHYAYVKISEGCDNRCAYCMIPDLRGAYRSRAMSSVISEARKLAVGGVKEINLISQDLTFYGSDRYGEPRLVELLRRLVKIGEIRWIRLLYTHPAHVSDDLIEIIGREEKICDYIDLPVQHVSDGILKRMGRRTTGILIGGLIRTLREKVPGIAVRTSLIVGFPGESERQFDELLDFVRETRFEHLGVFIYSKEEGTPAFSYPRQVNDNVKNARLKAVMDCQKEIVTELNSRFLGRTVEVLIDEVDDADPGILIGRRETDAPEVDGVVYVHSKKGRPGDFMRVKIIDTLEYDLVGEEA